MSSSGSTARAPISGPARSSGVRHVQDALPTRGREWSGGSGGVHKALSSPREALRASFACAMAAPNARRGSVPTEAPLCGRSGFRVVVRSLISLHSGSPDLVGIATGGPSPGHAPFTHRGDRGLMHTRGRWTRLTRRHVQLSSCLLNFSQSRGHSFLCNLDLPTDPGPRGRQADRGERGSRAAGSRPGRGAPAASRRDFHGCRATPITKWREEKIPQSLGQHRSAIRKPLRGRTMSARLSLPTSSSSLHFKHLAASRSLT